MQCERQNGQTTVSHRQNIPTTRSIVLLQWPHTRRIRAALEKLCNENRHIEPWLKAEQKVTNTNVLHGHVSGENVLLINSCELYR